jgi:hypothetical protein
MVVAKQNALAFQARATPSQHPGPGAFAVPPRLLSGQQQDGFTTGIIPQKHAGSKWEGWI